jgi:L-threonylcarbamoyladenylate synthase
LVLPLKAKGQNWKLLSAKTGTLGVRYPDNEMCMALVKAFGKPITTTSANMSGKPTAYSVMDIKRQYSKSRAKPDFYLDGGKLHKNALSTMLHIDGRHVTLIREGVINYHDVIKALK